MHETKVSAKSTSLHSKRFLLETAFCQNEDRDIVDLLLWLFAKEDAEHCEASRQTSLVGNEFTSADVLEALNVEDATKTLSIIKPVSSDKFFRNVDSVETLKILCFICSKTLYCADWNFLHKAVYHGKRAWVEYLIQAGYDINHKNGDGDTPLHCLGDVNAVEMTRLLIENCADVYAVNKMNKNFAHKLFRWGGEVVDSVEVMQEWLSYLLEKSCSKIWNGTCVTMKEELQLKYLCIVQAKNTKQQRQ